MGERAVVEPLWEIALAGPPGCDVSAAWRQWRVLRPHLDEVSEAEAVVLPAAWERARGAGVTDEDAARLDGLRRKAALTTQVTIARVLSAQSALRRAGIDSTIAGGASVALLGAIPPHGRSVRGADVWVARADLAAAAAVLGVRLAPGVGRLRSYGIRGVALPNRPGVMLRSQLPSVPPVDGRWLLAASLTLPRTDSQVDVLGPTEAVFAIDALLAAQQVAARVRRLAHTRRRQVTAGALVGLEFDRRLLQRLTGFDATRLRRLRRLAGIGGWRGPERTGVHG